MWDPRIKRVSRSATGTGVFELREHVAVPDNVNVNVNVEFKVTLHEQVRYRGTLQYQRLQLQFVTMCAHCCAQHTDQRREVRGV